MGTLTLTLGAPCQVAQEAFLRELLPDVLRFAGAVMIRRIVGIAHVADFESISNPDIRCAPRNAVPHHCRSAGSGVRVTKCI